MTDIIIQFQMSKENLTESGFEPETSGLTYQRSKVIDMRVLCDMICTPPRSNAFLCEAFCVTFEHQGVQHSQRDMKEHS